MTASRVSSGKDLPDGKGFIGTNDTQPKSSGDDTQRMVVVLNWIEDVKQRPPVP